MKQIKLYLPSEFEQTAESDRWRHLVNSVDKVFVEVRIYIEGLDINTNELEHELPYMTIDGKKKSFTNAYRELTQDGYKSRLL